MHDITLLAFALVLRSHSWRIPLSRRGHADRNARPRSRDDGPGARRRLELDPALLEAQASSLRRLARTVPLALAGPGATHEFSVRVGARRLDGDLVGAADEVART